MSVNANIKNETAEYSFDLSDVRFPRMIPLQTLADECGLAYKYLWSLCKNNKIVHIKSGNKYLVNVDKFIEFLNTGETEEKNENETRGGANNRKKH